MNLGNDRSKKTTANNDSPDGTVPVEELSQLIAELHVARLSQPTDEAIAKYHQLAEQIERQPGTSLWQVIKATLAWDSRNQMAAQGARGVNTGNYRMVYATEQTEVEIMIESQTRRNYIEGDIVSLEQSSEQPSEPSAAQTPALITLLSSHSNQGLDNQGLDNHGLDNDRADTPSSSKQYEVESDSNGRFRFENIDSGFYDMQLLLLNGSLIEINDIELA